MSSDEGTPARRARTAAQQRADATSTPTPESLVAEIEQTRQDLAETVDAIADKVSPKRVAKRTTKKATDAVKDGAAAAKEMVTDAAETVAEKATSAGHAAAEAGEAVKATVRKAPSKKVPVETDTAAASAPQASVTPTAVSPSPAPALAAASAWQPSDSLPAGKGVDKRALGLGAALVLALLVWRRRRR